MTRVALPKCGGRTRAGGLCRQPAGHGTPHPGIGRCKKHGGSTKTHVASAREVQARAAAEAWGRPIETTGTEALLEELRYTAGHVAFYRAVIEAIAPADFVWGVVKRKSEGVMTLDVANTEDGVDLDLVPAVGTEVTEAAGLNTWLKLYMEERRHLADVAERCIRVGIEERRVRLEEDKGALLVVGLQWLFGELGLSVRKLEVANGLAIRMLRALAAGRSPALDGEVVR